MDELKTVREIATDLASQVITEIGDPSTKEIETPRAVVYVMNRSSNAHEKFIVDVTIRVSRFKD